MRMLRVAAPAMLGVMIGTIVLNGCASASGPEESASATPPLSSSDLPTLPRPTAPPTTPTDLRPTGTVAGRVVAVTNGCVDVRTDDDEVYSLTGDPRMELRVGDVVTARIERLEDTASCGSGIPVRATSLRVVTG